MSLLAEALALCEAHGEDFWGHVRAAAAAGGHVLIEPDTIIIAEQENETTLWIWLCVGRGSLPKLCQMAPPGTAVLGWRRSGLADMPRVVQIPFGRVQRLVSHGKQTKTTAAGGGSLSPVPGGSAPCADSDGEQRVD